MNPEVIIKLVSSEGITLSLSSDGLLQVTGGVTALQRQLPILSRYEQALTAALAAPAHQPAPFDEEAFEERAAICEFDGGLDREEAEGIAWHEDDRRRCATCLNIRDGVRCKAGYPRGGEPSVRNDRPDGNILRRCPGYRPHPDDPDQRPGRERWAGTGLRNCSTP